MAVCFTARLWLPWVLLATTSGFVQGEQAPRRTPFSPPRRIRGQRRLAPASTQAPATAAPEGELRDTGYGNHTNPFTEARQPATLPTEGDGIDDSIGGSSGGGGSSSSFSQATLIKVIGGLVAATSLIGALVLWRLKRRAGSREGNGGRNSNADKGLRARGGSVETGGGGRPVSMIGRPRRERYLVRDFQRALMSMSGSSTARVDVEDGGEDTSVEVDIDGRNPLFSLPQGEQERARASLRASWAQQGKGGILQQHPGSCARPRSVASSRPSVAPPLLRRASSLSPNLMSATPGLEGRRLEQRSSSVGTPGKALPSLQGSSPDGAPCGTSTLLSMIGLDFLTAAKHVSLTGKDLRPRGDGSDRSSVNREPDDRRSSNGSSSSSGSSSSGSSSSGSNRSSGSSKPWDLAPDRAAASGSKCPGSSVSCRRRSGGGGSDSLHSTRSARGSAFGGTVAGRAVAALARDAIEPSVRAAAGLASELGKRAENDGLPGGTSGGGGSRGQRVGGKDREQWVVWCTCVALTLEKADQALGRATAHDGAVERVVMDNIREGILEMNEIMQSLESRGCSALDASSSGLCRRRKEEVDRAIVSANSRLEFVNKVRAGFGLEAEAAGVDADATYRQYRRRSQEILAGATRKRRQRRLNQAEIPAGEVEVMEDEVLGKSDAPGSGVSTVVHLANYNGLNTAVKTFSFEQGAEVGPEGVGKPGRNQAFAASVVREIETLKRLRGPHIVTVYGAVYRRGGGGGDSGLMLAMELLPGGSLRRRLERSVPRAIGAGPVLPLDMKALRGIVKDVCSGLAFLHGKAFVHGGLSSTNVLLDSKGTAKITDLGAALRTPSYAPPKLGSRGGPAAVGGRIRYEAPEVLEGKDAIPESDVFSFGMVVLECLTRELPWNVAGASAVADAEALARAVTSGARPDLPADAPPDLAALVERCLAPLPASRPAAGCLLAGFDEATGVFRGDGGGDGGGGGAGGATAPRSGPAPPASGAWEGQVSGMRTGTRYPSPRHLSTPPRDWLRRSPSPGKPATPSRGELPSPGAGEGEAASGTRMRAGTRGLSPRHLSTPPRDRLRRPPSRGEPATPSCGELPSLGTGEGGEASGTRTTGPPTPRRFCTPSKGGAGHERQNAAAAVAVATTPSQGRKKMLATAVAPLETISSANWATTERYSSADSSPGTRRSPTETAAPRRTPKRKQ